MYKSNISSIQKAKSPNDPKNSGKCFSKFMIILYVLLIGWIGLLLYFHLASAVDDTNIVEEKPLVIADNGNQISKTSSAETQPLSINIPILEEPPEDAEESNQEHKQSPQSNEEMHIVFSTDCSFFQDWQTLLVFHSAMLAKQPGQITRIASGCEEDKQKELKELYTKLYPKYHVHFTPDYKMDSKTKKKYDFYNKPYGLHHWLKYADPPIPGGVVVILIDPDMIILRPFTLDIVNNPTNLFLGNNGPPKDMPKRIGKGSPAAQIYGLGAPWATENSRHFNRTAVCGANSPCLKVSMRYGEQHYSVGPPYFVEKDDLLRLTESWTSFVPRVYERYPNLLAEMYAYSMAAAHTDLPHLTMRHFMISNIDMDEEGWQFIDEFQDDVCKDSVNGIYYPDHLLPNILHYCQFYRAGEFGFQKRRIRKSLFECDKPMMAALPDNIGTIRYKNRDGEILKLGPKQGRRGAFMLCTIHKSINAMVRYYKKVVCVNTPSNFSETVNVVDKSFW